jgi:hypothetical protein
MERAGQSIGENLRAELKGMDPRLIEILEQAIYHRRFCSSGTCDYFQCSLLRRILRAGSTLAVGLCNEHEQHCERCNGQGLSSKPCPDGRRLLDQINGFAAACDLV